MSSKTFTQNVPLLFSFTFLVISYPLYLLSLWAFTNHYYFPLFSITYHIFSPTFKHMPKNFMVVTLPGLFLAIALVHESNRTHGRPKSSILFIRLRPCILRRQLVHFKNSILGASATYDSSSKKYIIL